MKAHILPNKDVSYLDKMLLNDKGLLRVLPASVLRAVEPPDLSIWGNKKGVYCFPTVELIDWLRDRIGGRTAVEICSGNGSIGRALGITRTDSYIQTTPEMRQYYRMYNQQPIDPPEDVLRYEALQAVRHFRPQVVVASFATQLYQPGDEGPPKIGSSVYGVDELAMYPLIEAYYMVGNLEPHGDKRLFKYPHERLHFDWIVTRSMTPEINRIFVWEKGNAEESGRQDRGGVSESQGSTSVSHT